MRSKVQVQEEMIQKVCANDDTVAEAELRDFKLSLDAYDSAFGQDGEEPSGDAQVFVSQVQQTQEGDMQKLMEDINQHDRNN